MGINILCDAVPFCFGPISKMISVANHLNSKKANISLLASTTSKELGEKSGLFNIINCNSESKEDLEKENAAFKKADVFVTVMNPVSAEFAQKQGIPVIYIDSLYWMWKDIPENLYYVDKYFIQNFEGVQENIRRIGKPENAQIVGPIIDDSIEVQEQKEDYLIVNFGGMESSLIQIGKNSNYPFVIGELVQKAVSERKENAFFCGYNKILKKMGEKSTRISFGGKGHKEFLKMLNNSKLLLTTPGLTTAFEAFHYKTPTAFMLPENYSQFLNLRAFRKNEIADLSVHWDDFYKNAGILENEDEKKGVEKVLECIKNFEYDAQAKSEFKETIHKILDSNAGKLQRKQEQYLKTLGNNSAETIAKSIIQLAGGDQ